MQLGRLSVTSRMNFGLSSVRPVRYCAAIVSAARVGVRLPLLTPPLALVRPAIAAPMAPAFPAPTGTATVLLTLHELLLPPSANSFSPQWVD